MTAANRNTISSAIEKAGVIAIIRAGRGVDLLAAADALARGGLGAMGITLNTPGALEAIGKARLRFDGRMLIGAGTILSAADAAAAIASGAQFIVTPTMQPDSIALCAQRRVPIVCGCASPTEAVEAQRAGADFVKLFPAGVFGLASVRDILMALPMLRLVPTGGVTLANLADFLRAGCPAVAVGSSLVSKGILETGDWDGLSNLARKYVEQVEAARMIGATL